MCFDERWTQSRTLEPAADLTARRTLASRRATALRSCAITSSRSFLLAFLAEDVLARVLDALALVRLGRPEPADLGRNLSDFLAVDPGYHDLDRPRRRDRDAVGDRIGDVVAESEREMQVLALHRRPVAHPGDLQSLLEALGDAGDQIVDQRARQTPHGAGTLGLGPRRHHDAAGLDSRRDVVGDHDFELARWPVHLDLLALDAGAHALRHRHRLPTDARHGLSLFLLFPAQNTVHRISPPTF